MFDAIREYFASNGFMPHGMCFLWRPDILWMHVGSDLLIALAYFSIPMALVYFVRRRGDLGRDYDWLFMLFAAFILFCGVTHLMSIWTLWNPDYVLQGYLKLVTGLVSLATAIVLWPLVPKALALPHPSELEAKTKSLAEEVKVRRSAELDLERARDDLELRVEERTAELAAKAAELDRVNDQLSRMNVELARSNAELDDFAYIASHDLKEPLRGIHNFSAILIEDYADRLGEDGNHKLRTLLRLSERLESLISSLLDFSRTGRTELAIKKTDLNEVVTEVIESLRITLDEANVEVTLEPLPEVVCDSIRVGEVYRNLISNAMRYNDNQHKTISIGVQGANGTGNPVLFVRDNGIGIDPRHKESVFRIFKRLHPRDAYGGGSGAGLTIAKKIVEMHGGKIWLESEVSQGTTFYFTLGE